MKKKALNEADLAELHKRRVPCVIAYLSPFRLIASDNFSWAATIADVNNRTWDYVKLHEMAGGIDVGLQPPYHLVVGRDGCLALPPIERLQTVDESVAFFNRCLAALLLGGVYCEAITTDSLDFGAIIDWRYIRSIRSGEAAPNRFHKHIRYRQASALEAIALLDPRTLAFSEMQKAMKVGLEILNAVDRLSGDILLKGVTGIARRDWGAGLSNLWIVIEQIVSHLWNRDLLMPAAQDGSPKARRDQLKDGRTWTASVRMEMLYQKKIINLKTLTLLSSARKARNDLAHEGAGPSEASAMAAHGGVQALLRAALPTQPIPFFKLKISDHSLSDPFKPPPRIGEVQYWMEILKLPGEADLEEKEASLMRKTRNKPSTATKKAKAPEA